MQNEFVFTASKEQKENLKLDLKSKTKQLRQQKQLFKSKQRELSKFERDATNWEWKGVNYDQWCQFEKAQRLERCELEKMKESYRVRHIVYSMMRGKTIKQIENKTEKEKGWQTYIVYNKAKDMLHSLGLIWREE